MYLKDSTCTSVPYILMLHFVCFNNDLKNVAADLALTGDAADELMGGYSFTWRSEDPIWSEKRAQMCSKWAFCAPTLAEAISRGTVEVGDSEGAPKQSLSVFSPYMHSTFKDWALSNTTKNDCVGEREVRT